MIRRHHQLAADFTRMGAQFGGQVARHVLRDGVAHIDTVCGHGQFALDFLADVAGQLLRELVNEFLVIITTTISTSTIV
jgi:hypothetical protein